MNNRAPYLIIIAALLWSLDGYLRRNLYSLPSGVVVFWEHFLGLIILAPFLIKEIIKWRKLNIRAWLSIIAIALLGGTVGTIAYTSALAKVNYISLSVVVLLQQLQPIFTIVLAALLLREKVTKKFIGLAALALVAAYFVSFPDLRVNLATGSGTLIAALLAVAAAFAWGSSTVFGRYALGRLTYVSLTGLRFSLTAVFVLIYVLATGHINAIGALNSTQWWYVVAIVFSTGMVGLLIYYKGLARVPARVSTLLELTWPVSAVAVDWLFFGTRLTGTQWLGSLVLLTVILKISRDFSKRDVLPVGPES